MSFYRRCILKLKEFRWGAQSLVSLYLSLVSGIVVAFQYDVDAPFYSSTSLDLVIPFGRFWRSLHYFSSQFFFVLLMIHTAVVLFDRRLDGNDARAEGKNAGPGSISGRNKGKWVRLSLSIPVSALVLFTGYILRFDSTGESAGYIAESITKSIPVLGDSLNAFLFNISSAGLDVVYVNHVVGLGCLWGYLAWNHLRKYRVSPKEFGILIVSILFASYLFSAPVEPPWPGKFHILGPWFFIGLQELLRYLQPFLAGVIFPAVCLFFLVSAINDLGKAGWALKGTVVCCVVYSFLTVAGWSR